MFSFFSYSFNTHTHAHRKKMDKCQCNFCKNVFSVDELLLSQEARLIEVNEMSDEYILFYVKNKYKCIGCAMSHNATKSVRVHKTKKTIVTQVTQNKIVDEQDYVSDFIDSIVTEQEQEPKPVKRTYPSPGAPARKTTNKKNLF